MIETPNKARIDLEFVKNDIVWQSAKKLFKVRPKQCDRCLVS
jgi:hypothetical protein